MTTKKLLLIGAGVGIAGYFLYQKYQSETSGMPAVAGSTTPAASGSSSFTGNGGFSNFSAGGLMSSIKKVMRKKHHK